MAVYPVRVKPKLEPSECRFYSGWGALLIDDYHVTAADGSAHFVPAGFWCNGGSIPKAFYQVTFTPFDMQVIDDFIAHDWFYCSHVVSRGIADQTLFNGISGKGLPIKAGLVKAAVRSFGVIAWRDSDNDRAYMDHLRRHIVATGRSLARYGLG